jgi:hypothetical protein
LSFLFLRLKIANRVACADEFRHDGSTLLVLRRYVVAELRIFDPPSF